MENTPPVFEEARITHFNEVAVGDRICDDIVAISKPTGQNSRWYIETQMGLVLRGVETSVIWCQKRQ